MSEQIFVESVYWESTEDVFSEGVGDIGMPILQERNVGMYDSVEDMVNGLSRKFGIPSDLKKWQAFEDGRIDVQMLVDEENNEATERQIASWKKGEMKLWIADISIIIQLVRSRTPSVSEMVRMGVNSY